MLQHTCSELADTLTAHVLELIRLSFHGSTVMTSPAVTLLEVSSSLYPSSVHRWQRMWTVFIDHSQQENPPDTRHCSGVFRKSSTLYAKLSAFVLTNLRRHYKTDKHMCNICVCANSCRGSLTNTWCAHLSSKIYSSLRRSPDSVLICFLFSFWAFPQRANNSSKVKKQQTGFSVISASAVVKDKCLVITVVAAQRDSQFQTTSSNDVVRC